MKTIQIIKGTFGHLPEGAISVVLKDSKSGPFEVSDAVADRLVSKGIAKIAEAAEGEGYLAAYDESMTKKQLIDVGKGLGVELDEKMTKAEMLKALDEAVAKEGEEPEDNPDDEPEGDTGDEESDDETAPPTVSAAEPE